jgi:hypothetical protein
VETKWPCEGCALLEDERDAYRECLKIAAEALHQIYDIGDFGGHARETAFKALGRLEEMKYKLGEF